MFRALFLDDLAICFHGWSLDTIEIHLQQAVKAIQEWATRNGFKFAAQKCKVIHFTAPQSRVHRPPAIRIGNTFLPVEESTKFLGLWWDSRLSFKEHISVLKTQCRETLNLIWVVAHLKWGGDRDTLLMLYRAIVRSKLDYGCIVYGTASNTNLRQLAFTTLDWDWHWEHSVPAQSPACTQRPMKPLWRNVGWSYPCITIWKLVPVLTTQHIMPCMNLTEPLDICIPNRRGGMTRHPAPAIGLKVEAAMASAEINAELVCPLGTPSFPPGTQDYDPKRHDLIEGVSKCMISREEAQAKFNEYHKDHMMKFTQMVLKWMREWGQRRSSTAISRMVRQPAANCPKDCQTIAPSLLLRLQPSLWHWTITDTWVQFITM